VVFTAMEACKRCFVSPGLAGAAQLRAFGYSLAPCKLYLYSKHRHHSKQAGTSWRAGVSSLANPCLLSGQNWYLKICAFSFSTFLNKKRIKVIHKVPLLGVCTFAQRNKPDISFA
jgi:hypothetical protein